MLSKLLNIIAPEQCIECGTEGLILCDWCRLSKEALPSRCFVCHSRTTDYEVCGNCRRSTSLNTVYVFAEYEDIAQNLIRALKFGCKRHAAIPIGQLLSTMLPLNICNTVLVPVASVPRHARQRGFDHIVAITRALANQANLPVLKLLSRTASVRQVGASRQQRKQQIKGNFRIVIGRHSMPSHVILVDDVITTGATLNEAAKVLKRSGVKRVDAIVLAYSK